MNCFNTSFSTLTTSITSKTHREDIEKIGMSKGVNLVDDDVISFNHYDFLSTTFSLLSILDLCRVKLVSKQWKLIENDRLLTLAFYSAIQGKNILANYFSYISAENYFNAHFPKEKSTFADFSQSEDKLEFVKALFKICFETFEKEYTSEGLNLNFSFLLIPILEEAAENNCMYSKIMLGLTYMHPEFKLQDSETALTYLEDACKYDKTGFAYLCKALIYSGKIFPELQSHDKYVELLNLSAEKKWSQSFYLLGQFLSEHPSSLEDKKLALEWFQKAAEFNDPHALHQLANAYKKGLIEVEDNAFMNQYLVKAAELGAPESLYQLGKKYYLGSNGFEKNIEKAIEYFKASNSKYFSLMPAVKMCTYYSRGFGVPKDWKMAKNLLRSILRASETPSGEFSPENCFHLGWLHEMGFGHKRDLEWALNFYEIATDADDLDAWIAVGSFYEEGDFVLPNTEEMLRCYGRAAAKEHPVAQFKLCQLYSQGFMGIDLDTEKAKKYFQFLSIEKHTYDKLSLGLQSERYGNIGCCYREGFGVEKNPELALSYFEKAANLGHASAQFKLCLYYAQSETFDDEKSKHYFLLLSEEYHPEDHYRIKERYKNISFCYSTGTGAEKNPEKELHYKSLMEEIGERYLYQTWL